jgi:hypothetical protein
VELTGNILDRALQNADLVHAMLAARREIVTEVAVRWTGP